MEGAGSGSLDKEASLIEVTKPASVTTVRKPSRRDDVAGSTTLTFLRMRREMGSLRTQGFAAASFGRLDRRTASASRRGDCREGRHNSLILPSLLGRTWVLVSMRHDCMRQLCCSEVVVELGQEQ